MKDNFHFMSRRSGTTKLSRITLQTGVISAAIVLNEMRRLTENVMPKALDESAPLLPTLAIEPLADCSRYDALRSVCNVH